MKGIVINKDIEEYQHDAWRGFSVRQIVFGSISVSASAAVILFAYLVCYMPVQAAVYLGIPVGVAIALAGFMQVDDMTFREYLQEMWRLAFAEPLTWQSEEYDTEKEFYENRAERSRKEMALLEKKMEAEMRRCEKQTAKGSGKVKERSDNSVTDRGRKRWKERRNRNSRECRTRPGGLCRKTGHATEAGQEDGTNRNVTGDTGKINEMPSGKAGGGKTK